MKTSFWRRWCDSLRGGKPTCPVSRAKARRQPLCLEVLEDRLTPTLTLLDLNMYGEYSSSNPAWMVTIGSTAYFSAYIGGYAEELWKSDGTAAGTTLVKDIYPGDSVGGSYGYLYPNSSSPRNLTNVNGTLFFTADGTNGYELWKSDGTEAGTVLVKDINPGSASSLPTNLTNVDGTLFFAADDGTNGYALWKSDGTAAGTVLVKDINPSSDPRCMTGVNGTLFFTTNDGTADYELWKSDGTAAGTVFLKDFNSDSGWGSPDYLTNLNGTLFFTAKDGTDYGLWKSDGTAAGTVLVASGFPIRLTNVNGTLWFAAYNATNGEELWKSDGTAAGTVLVKDINPGAAGSVPHSFTNVNGTLFFEANDGSNSWELWKSNGTAAGTVLVKDINPGSAGSDMYALTNVNGTLFVLAYDGTYSGLWKSDGTAAGTMLVANLSASGLTNVSSLTNVNGTLIFSADDGVHGQELWVLDENGLPSLSVSDVTLTEGNVGTQSATFTVALSAASTLPVTVSYATADGSATVGSDYQAATGTLTFAPGETSKTISVLVNGDRLGEPWESFVVLLSDPTNAVIDDASGQCDIWDDEPRVTISDATVMEGNTGSVGATFMVGLSRTYDVAVTVPYATADITTAAGSDYTASSGVVIIPAGQTSATFTVPVIGDRLGEPNETFVVNLSSPTNAIVADAQGVGTIVDNEPRISISDVSKSEGKNGKTTSFTFTVTLSAAYDQPVTMSYQTVNGTAKTSDSDYIAKTGTLTFAPGQTSKTITIEVKGDSKREANETFYLDLYGLSSNALFTKNRGIGTILNDD